ncbi:MAG: DUF1700 domain-containing protein [Bacilli bacterium]
MNKKKFLKELENRLDVLKEEEKKDILNEYEGHIDLKVKNGKTEEEAVKDFGKIDDLVAEILDAYKIKKDYKKQGDSLDKYIEKFVDTLKEVFKNITASINDDTIGFIFKLLIVLIAIGFLKIPFYIIEHIGRGIFGALTFNPLDNILIFIWVLVVQIVYVIAAFMLAFSILKKKDVVEKKEEIKKETKKKETKREEKKETKKIETKEEKKRDQKIVVNSSIQTISTVILKIGAIMITIPLIFMMIGFAVGLGILIKLVIEGIVLFSVLSIIVGFIFLNGLLIDLIYTVVFRKRKRGIGFLINLIIGLLLIGFGSASIVFDFVKYDYVDELPNHSYQVFEKEYTYSLDGEFTFYYRYGDADIVIDDNLTNKMKVKAIYYDELIDLNEVKYDNNKVKFSIDGEDYNFKEVNAFYKMIKRDLKDKKLYNYSLFFKPKYEIYVNSQSVDGINIIKIKD